MLRFLIDECLAPALAGQARKRGHHALHVIWADRAGHADHSLMPYILGGEFIFVTNNGADFRPLYRSLDIHPGLVVILPSVRRLEQVILFDAALDRFELEGDLINKLLEVDINAKISMTDLPASGTNL